MEGKASFGRRRKARLAVLAALLVELAAGAQLVRCDELDLGEATSFLRRHQPPPPPCCSPPRRAPTVAFTVSPASANEGETKTYTYSISGPGMDTVSSVTTSCGANGTESNASTTGISGIFECTFSDGPETSTVTVQATDSDNAVGNEASQLVSIANVGPTVTFLGADAAYEGQSKHYTFAASDPGDDTLFIEAASCGAFGTRVGPATFDPDTGGGSFDCTFLDGPVSNLVSITVSDSEGVRDGEAITVTVAGVGPKVSLVGADRRYLAALAQASA